MTATTVGIRPFPVPVTVSGAKSQGAVTAPEGVELVSDAFQGALNSYSALPTFLYPSVTGTAAEKTLIFETLDRLPMKDVGAIPTIRVFNDLSFMSPRTGGTALGVTFGTRDMLMSRTGGYGQPNSDYLMRYIVLHEGGHAHDFQGGIARALFMRRSNQAPWGGEPFTTRYAESMAPEDFAEAHAFYHLGPDELRQVGPEVGARTTDLKEYSPEKWQAMHASEQPNLLERIVSQKPFRETGRLIGRLTSNHIGAGVHTVVGFLGTIAAFDLVTDGAWELIKSRSLGDAAKAGLSLTAGLSLAVGAGHPLLGPAALALLGAKRGLEKAEAATGGSKTAVAVGGALGGVVGGVAGPLGGTLAGYAAGGPVGGVVGLVAGSLLGFSGGSALGAKAALALTR